jgi:hypothetical protein
MPMKTNKEKKLLNEQITKELKVIYADANCTNCPSEWFFPENKKGGVSAAPGSNLHCAFLTCNECKVKTECFNFARTYDCVGVWGGRLFTFAGISKLNRNGDIT